jgi:hypothetical protein
MDRGSGWFTMDQGHGHGGEHAGALVPGRFWPWGPDARWVKGRGLYRDSILPITEAWEEAVGRRTGGRALAQNGDDIGTVGDRRRVVGVGASPGSRLPFIGWRRGEGPWCLQWPALKELQCFLA